MLTYNSLISTLDGCAEKTFGEDYSEFSPVFMISIEKTKEILYNLYHKDSQNSRYFINYWHKTILEAYINGVYSSAHALLNKKKGKINSFQKGAESQRDKEIRFYENNFSRHIKSILI